MSELYELESEIKQLQAELGRDIEGIQRKDPSQRTKEISRCSNKLTAIKIRIESFELETLQLRPGEKAQYNDALNEMQSTQKNLKKELDRKKVEKVVNLSIVTDEESNKHLEDMDGQELIKAGDKYQKDGMDALQRMMANIHSADQKADDINLNLHMQNEKIGQIEEKTRDIQSELKRAGAFLKYFAKSVYTDKLLSCLTILCVIAVLIIIIIKLARKGKDADTDVVTTKN